MPFPVKSLLLLFAFFACLTVLPAVEGVQINATTRHSAASAAKLILAEKGRALVPIILSEKASPATKMAAAELAEYLGQMTGATFEVKTGDGAQGLILGTIAEFSDPALAPALEIFDTYDGREAYAICTEAKRVRLIGATELGASHAAYRFLEELGCRWFFPSKNWELVPKTPVLTFQRDITDRPAFLSRRLWYGWGLFDDAGHPQKKSAGWDYESWRRRNQQAESFVINTGHALFQVIDNNPAIFKEHPEYLALTEGKRQGRQLELANPAVRKLVVEYALDYFKKNPTADMVSLDPEDGGGWSESPESKALGTPGDAIFGMANEVAKVLQKKCPGKMVGLYAYNWHSDPPPFALEPNVYIQLTMGFNGGKLSLNELFEQWPKKAKNLGFYEYYSVWRWDFDRWPGGNAASVNYLKLRFDQFTKANTTSGAYATSISAESSNNWGPNGRGYYLSNKMMWNPQTDVEAVLRDFYTQLFGPAAEPMRKYYELADNKPLMTPGVIGLLFRHVAEASKLAADRPDVQARLDDLKNYLRFEHLCFMRGLEPDAAKKAALELEAWKLAYRTRYSHMNHWQAIYADWVKPANGAPTPWKVEEPVTHEETERNFKEGLAYFPELTIPTELKFSAELATVRFPGVAGVESYQNFQEGATYLFSSIAGAPVEMRLTAGGAYGGLRQSWSLTSVADGREIAAGKPKAGEVIPLKIAVPAAGLYRFKYDDGGAYWDITIPSTQPFSIPLQKENGYRTMKGVQPLYFYVPKGTKQIEYYFTRTPWQAGGPHKVVAPDGTVAKDVTTSGEYVTVPVPAGMDGKVWSFRDGSFGHWFFFNLPNYLSPSPATMLLPRDMAEKDGLEVMK